MNLEEKAIQYVMLDLETRQPRKKAFISGYKECIKDVEEFIRVNPKCTNQQITDYLKSL